MKINYPILFSFLCLFLFSECKKGDGDPAISLRSRKSRLTGNWRLVSGTAAYTSGNFSETYTFDGAKLMLYTSTSSGLPAIYTGIYLLNIKIVKDGTMHINETLAYKTLDVDGTWNFNSGVGEAKNKEAVIFNIDKINSSYTFGYHLFNRNSTNFIYQITELRDKKLIIHSAGKVYSNANGDYVDYSTDYTFMQ